ncbi:carboxynorspermidine decarboxylase [Sulfurospirillum sp. 1612]|uniref:carboxynorspermidine decarboxylase n=1 Tax=Sulfurospirillum sp. 1612 TaxID=3094835 RepID=UPI002F95D067
MFENLKTPSYVCFEELLEKNLKLLSDVKAQSGAKILLALKGFSFYHLEPLVSKYLDGCCASGLWEAKLSAEKFKGETHTYSPAFKEEEIDEILSLSHHVVFNSFAQWEKYKDKALGQTSCGLRINPEVSCAPVELYNPCGLYSRFGVTQKEFDEKLLEGLEGLHFHALCEQGADALEIVLEAVEAKFGKYIHQMKWVNFGGGHHITKAGYDVEKLISLIRKFRAKYDVEVYLEPGEAIGWEVGVLVARVQDIIQNGMPVAILDASAEAHMPDTLAMPYRAQVRGAGLRGEKAYTYKLTGNSCLSGDIMGDYSFDAPLKVGDVVIFEDQIHYTIVKNTTFNGIQLPSLAVVKKEGILKVVKEFSYEDYRDRN